MIAPVLRPITDADLPEVLNLMSELYSHQHMKFERGIAASAVRALLSDHAFGRIYLIYIGNHLAGYFALTFCFSLEFHGRFGLLDELYIREPYRAQGLGHHAEALAASICKAEGFSALRLEVGQDNAAAESLYARLGFNVEARKLMTKWL